MNKNPFLREMFPNKFSKKSLVSNKSGKPPRNYIHIVN